MRREDEFSQHYRSAGATPTPRHWRTSRVLERGVRAAGGRGYLATPQRVPLRSPS